MGALSVIDRLKKYHYFYLIVIWYFCLNGKLDYIEYVINNQYLISSLIILPVILMYTGHDDGFILLILIALLAGILQLTISNTSLGYFLIITISCILVDLWLYMIMKVLWLETLQELNTSNNDKRKFINVWNLISFLLMATFYLVITYLIINVISSYLKEYQTITTLPHVVKFLLDNKEYLGLSIVLSRVYTHKKYLDKN